jgi:hypothetical protein
VGWNERSVHNGGHKVLARVRRGSFGGSTGATTERQRQGRAPRGRYTTNHVIVRYPHKCPLLCDHHQSLIPILGLDIPLSPVSPSSLSSAVDKTRKYSPLTDLIESEKAYVQLLTGIIRVRLSSPSRYISCLIVRTTECSRCVVTIKPSPTATRRHVSQCGRSIQNESHAPGSEIFSLPELTSSSLISRRSSRRSAKIRPLPRLLVTC